MWFRKIKSLFNRKQDSLQLPDSKEIHINSEELDKEASEDLIKEKTHFNRVKMQGTSQRQSNYPEIQYIEDLIIYRLNSYYFVEADNTIPVFPSPETWQLPLGNFIIKHKLNQNEAILLLLGLVPHIKPDIFDKAIERKIGNSSDFPGIGGVRGKNCRFFLPTAETVLFLLSDNDIEGRLQVQQMFGAEHLFRQKKIIWLEDMQNGEPAMHGRLVLSADYAELFTYGIHKSPQFSVSFPAQKIAPQKVDATSEVPSKPPSFNDLVISDDLMVQIGELKNWLKYNDELVNRYGMKYKLKKGYRTLFYGPPGTGKTFTAQILGNELPKEVFRIDLSMVVSKYIGETEKNLELLFARAEDKGWILFFDEADALFGKRTGVRDAHDKYANQEVSYLLQRIEDYNGLIILATNLKNNIDESFIRRFNSILKFPFPDADQRALIWRKSFPLNSLFVARQVSKMNGQKEEKDLEIYEEVDIPELVKRYEMSGGNIINVVHYAGIKAVEKLGNYEKVIMQLENEHVGIDSSQESLHTETASQLEEEKPRLIFYLSDVIDGIQRELTKEGQPFSL